MTETKHKKTGRLEYLRALEEAGFSDSLVLRRESANKVMTDERKRLLDVITEEHPESKKDLSEKVGRDPAAVNRDLDLLFKYDLIEYEQDGARKIPKLKHNHIFVEPIL